MRTTHTRIVPGHFHCCLASIPNWSSRCSSRKTCIVCAYMKLSASLEIHLLFMGSYGWMCHAMRQDGHKIDALNSSLLMISTSQRKPSLHRWNSRCNLLAFYDRKAKPTRRWMACKRALISRPVSYLAPRLVINAHPMRRPLMCLQSDPFVGGWSLRLSLPFCIKRNATILFFPLQS